MSPSPIFKFLKLLKFFYFSIFLQSSYLILFLERDVISMADFFRRVEKKYIITKEQYLALKDAIKNQMIGDEFGESTICNIYFDTNQYDLIRNSIAKPVYKDKVRLRSYNIPKMDGSVYLEVKRKYEDVVSKRRIGMKLNEFYDYLRDEKDSNDKNQIKRELNYYFNHYGLVPTMYLSYHRVAYYDKDNKDFRLTFDNNIIAREYDLSLEKGSYGENILEKDQYIMEVKTLGAMPIWFVRTLEELNIVPGSFSKYGTAYTKLVLKADKKIERIA